MNPVLLPWLGDSFCGHSSPNPLREAEGLDGCIRSWSGKGHSAPCGFCVPRNPAHLGLGKFSGFCSCIPFLQQLLARQWRWISIPRTHTCSQAVFSFPVALCHGGWPRRPLGIE